MILLLTVFCGSNETPPQKTSSVLRYDYNASPTSTTPLAGRRLATALKASQTLPDQEAFLDVIDGLADSPSSSLASSRRSSNGQVERNDFSSQ